MGPSSHVNTSSKKSAGRTLLASHDINAGEDVIRIERPLAAVLDSKYLKNACSECFLWSPTDSNLSGSAKYETQAKTPELKACLGCKVVKYCSKSCQTESWKRVHRYECPIFKTLYPKVLPNTVRLLMQPLLRRRNNTLSDDDWNNFTGLQSHLQDFKAEGAKNQDGLTTWQTFELMSQAVQKYAGSSEPINSIQGSLARVMINSHTLTTPTLDPLGLCIDPLTSLLNHSCTPNAHIVFDGYVLSLRSLTSIPSDTELTISYIDTTNPTATRQKELQSRYFFKCECQACSKGLTNGQPDPVGAVQTQQLLERVIDLQTQAAPLPPVEAEEKLNSALSLLRKEEYPRFRQPYAGLLHACFLNATARSHWVSALRFAVQLYLKVELVQYPLPWHPIRVVRRWVLLRLIVHIASLEADGDESVKALRRFDVDYMVVSQGLWRELIDAVAKSHGRTGRFAEEVAWFGKSVGIAGAVLNTEHVKVQWTRMSKIADWLE